MRLQNEVIFLISVGPVARFQLLIAALLFDVLACFACDAQDKTTKTQTREWKEEQDYVALVAR